MNIREESLQFLQDLHTQLKQQNFGGLEATLLQFGLDKALSTEVLRTARKIGFDEGVILLATLGKANTNRVAEFGFELLAYQVKGKVLTWQQAWSQANQLETTRLHPFMALAKALFQAMDSEYPPEAPLGFGRKIRDKTHWENAVLLLCDARRFGSVLPFFQQWQGCDESDMPWLLTSRAIMETHEDSMMALRSHFKILDPCLRGLIAATPKSYATIGQEMWWELSKLRLDNRDVDGAWAAMKSIPNYEDQPNLVKTLSELYVRSGDMPQARNLLEKYIGLMLEKKLQDGEAPRKTKTNEVFASGLAEQELKDVNRILRDAGLAAMLISGSLLGCIRENKILPHDKDVDMGIIGWENQYKLMDVLSASGEFFIDARDLKGEQTYLIAATHCRTRMPVDFFFFHDRGTHFRHAITFDIGHSLYFNFSKFQPLEHEFLGEKFLIPSNFETNLSENYGDWRTPNSEYVVTLDSPALEDPGSEDYQLQALVEIVNGFLMNCTANKMRHIVQKAQTSLHFPPLLKQRTHQLMAEWLAS